MSMHSSQPMARPSAAAKTRAPIFIIAAIPVIIIIAVLVLVLFPWPCTAAVNGMTVESTVKTTVRDLVDRQKIIVKPGDLLAVDGSVLQAGGGEAMHVTVNGEYIDPHDERLVQAGDEILVEDGDNVMESFTEEYIETAPGVRFEGKGAIHLYTGVGKPGQTMVRTGSTSGISVNEVMSEPVEEVVREINVDTGEEKLVALTFDDGPWAEWTEQILDILEANGAKATFFTVGERIKGHEATLARASEAGHQICTHSWDHASGSGQGVNLGYMTPEEQIAEVANGQSAISDAIGKSASNVFRTPGGNFSEETAAIVRPYVSSEIGWNIDTRDWTRPGAEAVYHALLGAQPGNVVLMHDGGGDRSQTVAALRDALPELTAQGFRFITIDELLEYVQ